MKTVYTAYAVTVSDFSSGPPASPSTGDIWIASNVDTNGTRWSFQYNAGSSSAYKWEFIGGPPAYTVVDTFETTTVAWGSTTDLATVGPQFTCARGGDYSYILSARTNNSVAGISTVTMVKWNGGANNDGGTAVITSAGAGQDETVMEQGVATAVTAGQSIKMVYATLSSGTGRWGQRRLFITPVRIS